MSARINTRVIHWDYADKSLTACVKNIILLYLKHSYWTGNDVAVMGVMDVTFSLHSFYVVQPCQVIYQVCHESVERLIQYGILLVAEVKWQRCCRSGVLYYGWFMLLSCETCSKYMLLLKACTMCPGLRLLHSSVPKCQTLGYSQPVMLHDSVCNFILPVRLLRKTSVFVLSWNLGFILLLEPFQM